MSDVEAQMEALSQRYTARAEAYDRFWSPIIAPAGRHLLARLPLATAADVIDVGTGTGALLPAIRSAAPAAAILGVDRSEGMLRLARSRHDGSLARMDAQKLELADASFDVAVMAFVLFHLPDPRVALSEIRRVLRPGGTLGVATWGPESFPAANSIWEEELDDADADRFDLPAVTNQTRTDSEPKLRDLLELAGFALVETWTETIDHRWPPEDHLEYMIRSSARVRLASLDSGAREVCVTRVRARLATATPEDYLYRGAVVLATAVAGATPRPTAEPRADSPGR